jgi:hypothetical protein
MGDTAPRRDSETFRCPFCRAYARQHWRSFVVGYESKGSDGEGAWRGLGQEVEGLALSFCDDCRQPMVWWGDEAIWPPQTSAPRPSDYMPDAVRAEFEEARQVFDRSPRSAVALLRLSLRSLCRHLGQSGRSIDEDIGALVSRGLPVTVREALEAVRMAGDEAVEPGKLDLHDDRDAARAGFDLVNLVVEKMIAEPALWRV